MNGTLYGIGTGPGDPELLTYKAVRILNECSVIAVPAAEKEKALSFRIIKSLIKDAESKKYLCLPFPMTRDRNILEAAHKNAAAVISEELRAGKNVAFAVLGDPSLYASYSYVSVMLEHEGYSTEIVNGVTSFCAAASAANRFLTLGDEELHVFPTDCDIAETLKLSGTKIYMKSASRLNEFRALLDGEKNEVILAENCGLENEAVYYGAENFPENVGYFTIIIVRERN